MAELKTSVLIIGSGPAGYTAGIYAARAGLNPILVSGNQVGGQLTLTSEIENFPGFPEALSGHELMNKLALQAENVGVKIVHDIIDDVLFSRQPFECRSESNVYIADTVIIATGASARWVGAVGENKFVGFGVSSCATCDGFFYKDKDVAVVGGGNTAAAEALHLTHFARSVTLVHRRDALRADKIMQQRLFDHPKVHFEWDSVVKEVKGKENPLGVESIVLENIRTDKIKELKVDGMFVAVGHVPNTGIFKGQLELDEKGYVITKPNSCQTSVEGVFAAGDVKDPNFRQAIIASGSGCIAALEAQRYLMTQE